MNKLYLKAITEDVLIDAIMFARGIYMDSSPFWRKATHEFALDIIGTLYNKDAVWEGTKLVTPPTKMPGFHANIICNDRIKDLIDVNIIITPTPARILREWA